MSRVLVILRAAIPFLLAALSTLLHGSALLALATLKAVPAVAWRARVSRWLVAIGGLGLEGIASGQWRILDDADRARLFGS